MTSFTHDGVTLILGDCLEHMARMADGAYSLSIVDPPYGVKNNWTSTGGNKITLEEAQKISLWDRRPSKSYFSQLMRVSENQIVWGANYFYEYLWNCYHNIFWDKKQRGMHFSDGELAWTSFNSKAVTVCDLRIVGSNGNNRIHPTQKPTALYRWLLQNYARPGDTILDTHLGSGSSAIAAWEMGCTFTGIEIDQDYYNGAVERFKKRIAQPYLPGLVQPAKPRQDVLL